MIDANEFHDDPDGEPGSELSPLDNVSTDDAEHNLAALLRCLRQQRGELSMRYKDDDNLVVVLEEDHGSYTVDIEPKNPADINVHTLMVGFAICAGQMSR